MVDGMLTILPCAKIGHIGMCRNHDTLEPEQYYCNLPADIAERTVFILDPMLATGGSLAAAITLLKEKGAKKIRIGCTHPVLSGPAIERLKNAPIEEIVVLDTIQLPPEKILPNMTVLSSASVFAEAIDRIYEDLSVSTLFV